MAVGEDGKEVRAIERAKRGYWQGVVGMVFGLVGGRGRGCRE